MIRESDAILADMKAVHAKLMLMKTQPGASHGVMAAKIARFKVLSAQYDQLRKAERAHNCP